MMNVSNLHLHYTPVLKLLKKEIIRNVFNGDWDKVPSSFSSQLREKNINNNLGEIIKILMITSSGSEGITLKNTRYVHIMEPYWHPVQELTKLLVEQEEFVVIKDLPPELRTVEVFMYLMKFKDSHLKGDPTAEKEDREALISTSLKTSMADRSKINKDKLYLQVTKHYMKFPILKKPLMIPF